MAQPKVALITGGASGMGLAVATALSNRGGWRLHLLDLNSERGNQAAKDTSSSTFHQVNITDYNAFAAIFQKVFDTEGRLDFVFANAGIVERFSFYDSHPTGKPPPPPDQSVIDINLKAVINTSWLAQHYFRQSKQSDDKNLVMTASVGGFYRCQASPAYCAAKHGVVGLMRSIAPHFSSHDGIRVNAICPGTVRTNLLDEAAWSTFKHNQWVPIQKIASAVLMLIDGYDDGGLSLTDGKPLSGKIEGINDGEKLNGKAVELSGSRHYYRDQYEFSDENMATTMGGTDRVSYDA